MVCVQVDKLGQVNSKREKERKIRGKRKSGSMLTFSSTEAAGRFSVVLLVCWC